MSTNSMDHTPVADERKARLEDLLYMIGGCEVAIRHNQPHEFGSYPPLAHKLQKIQEEYLKRLERVMNGLPENES